MWPKVSFLCSRLSDVTDDRELYKANSSKSKLLFCFFFHPYKQASGHDDFLIFTHCVSSSCLCVFWLCTFPHWYASVFLRTWNITHSLIFECRVAYFQKYALQPFLSLCSSESQSEQWISVGLTAKQTGLPLDWCRDCSRPPWSPGDHEHILTEHLKA